MREQRVRTEAGRALMMARELEGTASLWTMTLNARDDIFDGSAVRNLKPVSDFLFVVGQNAVPTVSISSPTPAVVAVSFRTASSLTVSYGLRFHE